MPRRKPFPKREYIHVCNRGFNKQQLFFIEADYNYFLKLLFKHLKRYNGVELIEYCILPNHFHFIFLNKRYWFSISNLLAKVLAWYSKYFEWHCGKEKWKKLLEGPFIANVLDSEKYLDWCVFYVRHNAVKHWLVEDMKDRKYSSFQKVQNTERENNPKLVKIRFGQYKKWQIENEYMKQEDKEEEN